MHLIFLGPPGAGKGTQAKQTAAELKIAHISTGDMLRAEIRAGSELGIAAKALIDRGELVSDDVILAMVAERIRQDDCANGFLFDGFPRTLRQAEALDRIASIDRVIDIEVPFDRLVDRISGRRMCSCGESYHVSTYTSDVCAKCGQKLYQRDDDREETVRNRLEVYRKQTSVLIDYYRDKGILTVVNGDQTIEKVASDIQSELCGK